MMNPVPWLQMTNMISYQGLVRTFPKHYSGKLDKLKQKLKKEFDSMKSLIAEYEAQKKVALQGDIEQLLKVPQKYSKVI